LDGVDSFNKLDAVVVKDGTGAQLARYELIYYDTHTTLRPPVAPGDSVQTLLLQGVRMLGKTSADGLPAYLFTYRDADSYRLSKMVVPAGGTFIVDYEGYPVLTNLYQDIHYDRGFYERSRRLLRKIWDADGDAATVLPDTTRLMYAVLDTVLQTNSIKLDRLTFPRVEEELPGGQGTIRHEFVNEADMDALGLSRLDKRQEAERRIRRGLEKATTSLNTSQQVIQTTTTWRVTPTGTWIGDWSWYYYRGMPQQAFWVRQDSVAQTLDGVTRWTRSAYNANGLVTQETVGSLHPSEGSQTHRVTETLYHGDDLTYTAVTPTWGTPSLESTSAQGNYTWSTFPPGTSTADYASVPYVLTTLGAGALGESHGIVTYPTSTWSVTSGAAYRIQGVVGCDQLQGSNLFGSAEVRVVWSGTSWSSLAYQLLPVNLPPTATRVRFDKLVTVPSGATTASLDIILESGIAIQNGAPYRSMRAFADSLAITQVIPGADATDADMIVARILDRPHVVTVKDGAGLAVRSTTVRYGVFGGLLEPDTTLVWMDANGDRVVGASEQVVQARVLSYDAVGNPLEVADAAGTVTTTRWGYQGLAPLAAFQNARTSDVQAWVFDDYPDSAALVNQGNWYTVVDPNSTGLIRLSNGAMTITSTSVSNALYAIKLNLASSTAGVVEFDLRVETQGDEGLVALVGGTQYQILWNFAADGTLGVWNGGTYTSLGMPNMVGDWHHVRLEWDQSLGWFTRMNGVRYPTSGYFALGPGTVGPIDRLEFWDAVAPNALWIDNVRTYPVTAQPGPLTTLDPVNLTVTGVTNNNGWTTRYVRDGLGRMMLARNGRRQVVGERGTYFSGVAAWAPTYSPALPNREEAVVYPDPAGHRDLNGDRRVWPGPWSEEGRILTTETPYEVPGGASITFKARTQVRLTPGFTAKTGATFRATIDPAAGGLSATGAVTFGMSVGLEETAQIGAGATLNAGPVSRPVVVRADVRLDATTGVEPWLLALDDGTQHVAITYNGGSLIVETRQNGQTSTLPTAWGIALNQWYTCVLELTPAGTVYVWAYPQGSGRWSSPMNPTNLTITGFPTTWNPTVKAQSTAGSFSLANLYVGPATVTLSYYDGLLRGVQTKQRTGATDRVTQTVYNRASLPEAVRGPVGMPESYPYVELTASAAGDKVTNTVYWEDPLARPKQVVLPGLSAANALESSYGYGGLNELAVPIRRVITRDEKGIVTRQEFDPLGHLTKTMADTAGLRTTTRFGYDALDRLVQSIAPQAGTNAYVYDTAGRRLRVYQPDMDDSTRYKYDPRGNLRFSQDARQKAAGMVTYFVYDAFNRVTRVGATAAPFSTLDPTVNYGSYAFETDAASWKTKRDYDGDYLGSGITYPQGRVTKEEENTDTDSGAEVTTRYAYDPEGRVRARRVTIEGLATAQTVQYQYDLAGRVSRLCYPDGSEVRSQYDAAGRVSQVMDGVGTPYASYTYAPDGNLATHIVGNTVVTGTYTYTLRDWLQTLQYQTSQGAGMTIFLDTLQYDVVGNVTQQVYQHGTAPIRTAAYGYDNLRRLTSFSLSPDNSSQTFAYDLNGNMTGCTTRVNGGTPTTVPYTYSYTSTPNRLDGTGSGTTGISYGYDANGWVITQGGNTISYDYRGLTTGYNSASYLCDSEGNRVKKVDGATTIYYIRGAEGSVFAESNGSGVLTTKYVYAGAKRVAQSAGGSTQYYMTDHLGNTRVLVNTGGTTMATYDYWPYGGILQQSGADATRFKFTGHERDGESGLDYMLARMCDPDDGRFLRPDPLAEMYPQLSPYVYAANNPLRFVDPGGRFLFPIHTAITREALRGLFNSVNREIVVLGNAWTDIKTLNTPRSPWYRSWEHYDSGTFLTGRMSVESQLNNDGLFSLGVALHAIQDFYAHSNYVELALSVFGEDGQLPTFDEAMTNTAFADLWASERISGIWADKKDGATVHGELAADHPNYPESEKTPGLRGILKNRKHRIVRQLAKEDSRAYATEWLRKYRQRREQERKFRRYDVENQSYEPEEQ
ncbi:MAG: hypothetical protein HY710_00565, partial [Candidatus Latescibacteria bacterium]|nr:hypothetical protein [Candidatus Latescibacterota bacterium]